MISRSLKLEYTIDDDLDITLKCLQSAIQIGQCVDIVDGDAQWNCRTRFVTSDHVDGILER